MEIIKTRITTEVSNWKEIAKAIRNGTIKEWVSVGDILTVNHSEYGLLDFDVLDFDRDMPADRPPCSTVTLQLHDLVLPEIPFDKNGGNSWENSSIRAWLNDREFMDGFNPEFASLIVPVNKVTNQNTEKEEHTEDSFFLLSKEEIAVDGYVYYANRRIIMKLDWIPASERLPEDNKHKIVTVTDGIEDFLYVANYGNDGFWHGLPISAEDVTAWIETGDELKQFELWCLLKNITPYKERMTI